MSLLNMKKILLNNLYQVYKPSLLGKNYGIIYLKEYGNIAFVDDNTIFTGKDIFNDEFSLLISSLPLDLKSITDVLFND